jgi:multicomponent Na+:H+ antiporter subunit G
VIDWISAVLLLCGSLFFLVAFIGLIRLPDLMCQGHAVAKASALGIGLILGAVLLHLESGGVRLIVVATLAFQLLTIPISSHLFGRLVYRLRRFEPIRRQLKNQ